MSWYSLCQIPFIFSGMLQLLSRTVYILWHVTSIITHSSYSLACHNYYHTQFMFSGMSHLLSHTVHILWHVTSIITDTHIILYGLLQHITLRLYISLYIPVFRLDVKYQTTVI